MAAINKALLIIDVQNDFCKGGALPAKNTKSLIQPLNETISWTINHNTICVLTRDWHPKDHCSFISQGGPWPDHCVKGTAGANFAEGLIIPYSTLVVDIKKDTIKDVMSYSAFGSTNLAKELYKRKVVEVSVAGIATEYCVKETVLDALRYNFKVSILSDLIRSVDIHPEDSLRAIEEMVSAGASLMTSFDWRNMISAI